jgi:hypothetical protein
MRTSPRSQTSFPGAANAHAVARRCVRASALAIAVGLISLIALPGFALASSGQVAILQDDVGLLTNPAQTLQQMRDLGVQMVRVSLRWSLIAPSPNSRIRPGFDATNPNAYPSGSWDPYDAIVRDAKPLGIQVMFVPSGFAPLWAQGPNPGRYGAKYDYEFAFEPSAGQFGQFVHALGTRYSGQFRPPGSNTPLPRVSTWEIYNEPNFGEDLAPQAINGSSVLYAPTMYRALADVGWGALQAAGHGHDTILFGSLAGGVGHDGHPSHRYPQGFPGTYGSTKPVEFMRELYCLDPNYHQYLGAAAAVRGCPTTAAGYRSFRAQHPVLFNASGFSDHPYPIRAAPNRTDEGDPNKAEFGELPHFTQLLDRMLRVYHGKRFPIWNTEYGYITCQPTCSHVPRYVLPATAASYINWAEYLSWRNPRIASTMQFLLYDPNPTVGTPEYGGFASGLIFYPTVLGGQPKPTYYAYRLPLYLPSTSTVHGRRLEVWGDGRPATFAARDTGQSQYVQVQFAPGSSSSWRALDTIKITSSRGYFDVRIAFPSSGSVRVTYTYPAVDPGLVAPPPPQPPPPPPAGGPPPQPPPPGGYTDPLALAPPVSSRTVKVTIR